MTVAHHLDRVSLSIGLGGDCFAFDHRYLLGTQPFRKPELRQYVHECLHLWQVLGSGYLSNVARDKWLALQRWEATGELPAPSGRLTAVDPAVGFSARDLSEALCRFWDVHVSGPPDLLGEPYAGDPVHDVAEVPADWLTEGLDPEVVERVREQRSYSGAQLDAWMLREDGYAEPYRRVLASAGSKRAAALFPIVGYFALQTPNPPRAFAGSLDLLATYPLPAASRSIHDIWRTVFGDVADACARAAFTTTGTVLTPGAPVLAAMTREGHVVYRHYASLLSMMGEVGPTDPWLALPGDPETRLRLAVFLVPPVVTFHDGRWAPTSPGAKLGLAGGAPGVLPQPELADASQGLYARQKAMGRAALLARLGPTR